MLFLPELLFILAALLFFILSLRKTADPAGCHKWAIVLASIGLLVTVASSRQEGMLFFDCYRVDNKIPRPPPHLPAIDINVQRDA